MKKLCVIISIMSLLLVGCGETLMNTPTKKVEMFLDKYKTLDNDVTTQLNDVVDGYSLFDDESKEEYKKLMQKHYKNLNYEVKEERINGDQAVVTTEIEVTDYSKIMTDANSYLANHRDEFSDSNGNYSELLFTKYRINKLKDAKDTVKYTIDFQVKKENKKWVLEDLTDEQEAKINGMYTY